MDTHYAIGMVHKVVLVYPDGHEIEINNAEVTVDVETETMHHYSLEGGMRHRMSVPMSEHKKVSIKTNDNVHEELIRLIRGD